MEQRLRSLFRTAGLIRQGIEARQDLASVRLPQQQWADCLQSVRLIHKATERGWHGAAARLRRDLLSQVDYCSSNLRQLSNEIQGLGPARKIPTEGDIYRELLALEGEFDDVECDANAEELCVTTPSVTMQVIQLGRFQIRLDWSRLDQSSAYRVVALDPNPAASNESVTHPHVSDETVCEGDGRRAIQAALDEGRLADFFLIVWRLLDTYAPGRAYVELSDWQGTLCNECDETVHEDERCLCCQCDGVYCPACMTLCLHCDRDFCLGCIFDCAVCSSRVCHGCRETCTACQDMVCPDCVSDGKCQHCHDVQEEQDGDETEQPSTNEAVVTLASHAVTGPHRPANEGACHV